jgi:flagellin-like hook-associated protein FlgL
MSILPLSLSRVTDLLQSSVATQNINSVQAQLVKVEEELSTGKAVNAPSDNPASAAIIQQLQSTLSYSTQYATNISQATSQLNETDSTLGNITTLLTQAQSIASANVSDTVSADARSQAATVVNGIFSQILSMANAQFNGTYLFGTDNATSAPYNQSAGGVEFMGSATTLTNTFEQGAQLSFQADPSQIFGGESTSISTGTNLQPDLQANDRLSDLAGATGKGITLGSIQIGNGTTSATVNLSGANSVGDVVADINASGLPGVTASLGQYGLQLTAAGGAQISVNEVGGDSTALDLGILQPTAGTADAPLAGQNLGAKVTDFTPLADLNGGNGIDPTGFNISNGTSSVDISLTGMTTVQDLVNAVNSSGTGVRAQINSAGTGIDFVNATQGSKISVSENGGTTATELGFRTFSTNTSLSSLNGGQGLSQPAGNQFSLTSADGTVSNISLNNATTVQDVINQINTQAAGKVTASFATTGNGIVLTDDTAGADKLTVTPLNGASTAADLGLTGTESNGVITGADVNPLVVTGIFSDLQALSTALQTNNTNGITAAAAALTTDSTKVSDANATVGAQVQQLTNRSSDLSSQTLANQTLLSQFQDVNYTTAVTQYQTLQNSLQASLEVTSKSLSMSLLNYIT